ncbi:E3 ubiquitin-protein ligase KCMF1 [Myotis davidii]|uniref:RING-type E3 ubiquitin transferase n=1 Tax=Myotis davidii TaxID=225400 RepID=L5LUF3_MYODS|nr:E3 ubiquitin-protein ligase KCMF1 [Myotis davidii]
MQCILTRVDFDLYYGGEAFSVEQPQSFTCPYCGKMGYTETSLQEHVTSEHAETSTEVICPICAALPGGDPNHVTDDFAAHLTLEHRAPRDLISFVLFGFLLLIFTGGYFFHCFSESGREEGGGGERTIHVRETHLLAASCTHSDQE